MMMLWDEFFRPLQSVEFTPATNIVKKDDEFKVVLAVPGYTQDQLSLHVDGNILEVRGHGIQSEEEEMYLRREIRQVPFNYHIELPERVQSDQIAAELNQGLLTIRIPLAGKKVVPVQIRTQDGASHLEA